MESVELVRCNPYCPVSIVVIHSGSFQDTAETAWSAVTSAMSHPTWDAELVLVGDDPEVLAALAEPFHGNVTTASSLSATVVRGVVVEVLRSGERLDVGSVSAKLGDVQEARAVRQLVMVLVCDDDAAAAVVSVESFIEAAEEVSVDPAVVLVSRGGQAAEQVSEALSGSVDLVSCHPRTDDVGAFATGLNRARSFSSAALVIAGEAVEVGAVATLALSGGHSRAGVR